MLTGAGLDQVWHHSRAHRLFTNARWSGDALGLALADLIVAQVPPAGAALTIAVDDTLFKRSGKNVFGAAWRAREHRAKGGRATSRGRTPAVPPGSRRGSSTYGAPKRITSPTRSLRASAPLPRRQRLSQQRSFPGSNPTWLSADDVLKTGAAATRTCATRTLAARRLTGHDPTASQHPPDPRTQNSPADGHGCKCGGPPVLPRRHGRRRAHDVRAAHGRGVRRSGQPADPLASASVLRL
jgi:hypothetical protein